MHCLNDRDGVSERIAAIIEWKKAIVMWDIYRYDKSDNLVKRLNRKFFDHTTVPVKQLFPFFLFCLCKVFVGR